jgi:hypothetical protein
MRPTPYPSTTLAHRQIAPAMYAAALPLMATSTPHGPPALRTLPTTPRFAAPYPDPIATVCVE